MTIEINPARFKTSPFKHQIVGVRALVANPSFALFDEMGAGKSKQVIDSACVLAEAGEIDTVVVVCPASVRCVWLDPEIGEIRKHSWNPFNVVAEFHAKNLTMKWCNDSNECNLLWIITNYEFLRSEDHLRDLCVKLLDCKTLLVLDESSYIKNRAAAQTKAVAKLRKHCARCVCLNGTPVTNSPLDLWSQMQVLDRNILSRAFKDNFYLFRAQYCDLISRSFGQARFKEVVGYKNLDDLSKRVAPYALRRLKKDCLDLPPKLFTQREVPLGEVSWKRYQELKRDAIITLSSDNVRLEPNAAVRIMRLAQLTSGILGIGQMGSKMPDFSEVFEPPNFGCETQDLSDEKLLWAVRYLTEDCTAKAVIVWCRWRRERERLMKELLDIKTHDFVISELYGGQNKTERSASVATFSVVDPDTQWRRILIAQQHAGGFGLNLVAATEAIYLSNDFSLGIRLQSEDRCHRPGQEHPVTYIDVLATGPKGQKTIDHTIFKALREKKSVADFTTAQWRKELESD